MVGLIDLDGKYPNIALMKIKTYYAYKAKMITPIEAWGYDKVYVSSLFNFTDKPPLPEGTIYGGTGFNIKSKLPEDIEKMQPDYSIYPNNEIAMQRYSMGCIRSCPYCVVQEKEGFIKPVEPMNIPEKSKWIYLLDNNFFASPNWLESIKHLIASGKPVSFEGIDVRILTEEHCSWLAKVKNRKQFHIAWDNPKDNLIENIKTMCKYIRPSRIGCYVLIGYWSTPEEDLYRVEKLREFKIDPFVMPFNKSDQYQKRFARWVNHKAVWKTVKWQDYLRSGYVP